MNILEQQGQVDQNKSQNCKISYLQEQNYLITQQHKALCEIVNIYKQVIDKVMKCPRTDQDKQTLDEMISDLYNQTERVVKRWERQLEKFIHELKKRKDEEDYDIPEDFFMEMVWSYEQSICEIKNQIHKRETLLQQLETQNSMNQTSRDFYLESNAVIRAIQSYDIYGKVAQKFRKEIVQLKIRKKKLQKIITDEFYGIKTVEKVEFEPEIDKTIKKVPAFQAASTKVFEDRMSKFQKAILIYKKKKLLNTIYENKVMEIKKKIKEKQSFNQLLKKKIEENQWELAGLDIEKHELRDQFGVSFSVSGWTEAGKQNDFSIDLSRVLPEKINKPKMKKTYAQYKAKLGKNKPLNESDF